eukprot:807021-Prymnesium_polylepis.1
MTDLSDAAIDIDSILDHLATEVRRMRARADMLEQLRERMARAPDSFSDMELQSTATTLVELRDQIASKTEELDKKIEVYEQQVSVLEQRLKLRKEILEADLGVMKDVPELVNVFASEHAKLLEQLQDARKFLQT